MVQLAGAPSSDCVYSEGGEVENYDSESHGECGLLLVAFRVGILEV